LLLDSGCHTLRCWSLAAAGSEISLSGTLTNTGNVRLRGLDFWPSLNISTRPTCYARPTGSNEQGTEWQGPADVAVGQEVACTVTWPIGQDDLEAATENTSSSGAQLTVAIAANATATDASPPVVVEVSSDVVLAVSHQPSLTVQVLDVGCSVPTQPGTLQCCSLWDNCSCSTSFGCLLCVIWTFAADVLSIELQGGSGDRAGTWCACACCLFGA
jgi:hypothetical protein